METKKALAIVLSLARENALSIERTGADPSLNEQVDLQDEALDEVEALLCAMVLD